MKTSEVLKIQKALGIALKPLEEGNILYFENRNCYLLDINHKIIGVLLRI